MNAMISGCGGRAHRRGLEDLQVLLQPAVLRPEPFQLGLLVAGRAGPGPGVDVCLDQPAAGGLPANPELPRHGLGQRGIRRILLPMIGEHPQRPLLYRGIDLLGHAPDPSFQTRKEAASNPRRFNGPPAGEESPDGSATYESKGPDHSELLIVRPDGSRFSEEIATCGFCLDGGGWCEFHPDCPQAGGFGPVYPSDLLAERQVSTPVPEPAPAAVSEPEPVAEPVTASAKPSKPAKRSREPVPEPAPAVDVELEESARQLGLRVWDGGGKPFHHLFAGMNRVAADELLNAAVGRQWVRLTVDDLVVPGTVNPRHVGPVEREPLSLRERIVRWGPGPRGAW
jgi:hypothetical protein